MSGWVWVALGISWATSIGLLILFVQAMWELDRAETERDELWDAQVFRLPAHLTEEGRADG